VPQPGPPLAPAIVEYGLREVRCRGELVAPTQAVVPLPSSTFTTLVQATVSYQVVFRIDVDGRPLGIGQPNRVGGEPAYHAVNDDLIPALAASRFAGGAERKGCVATYEPVVTPVATAPIALLHRYVGLRLGGPRVAAGCSTIPR
jgi:hypothetical protein